jgi:hypothetical protein
LGNIKYLDNQLGGDYSRVFPEMYEILLKNR